MMGSRRRLPLAAARVLGPISRHIRWKIIGPYAALSLAVAFLGTFVITNLVAGSLGERFTNQLVDAGRATEDAVVRQERRHLETLRAVAFTEGTAEAVLARDSGGLRAIIEPIAANAAAERIEVLDSAGMRVAGVLLADQDTLTYEVPSESADRSGWGLVQTVLGGVEDGRGDKFAEIVRTDSGPAFFTAGPLRSGDEIVGVVLVGTALDTFLPVAQTEVLAQITVYGAGLEPIGSTFAALEADDTVFDAPPAADVGVGFRRRGTAAGREYELLYGRLDLRGEPLGWYSVGLPTSFVTSANSATRLQLSAIFSLLVIMVLAVGLVLARFLTSPLMRLVSAAAALGRGDLTARSDVDSEDEIGSLSRTFNAMAERLQQQHLATMATLVSAIDARDPYTRGHSVRVGQLSMELGSGLGLTSEQLQHLQIGGYLHDIGKIGIRDAVLLKPSGLTPEERTLIEEHPRIGTEILAPIQLPPEVMAVVGQHHEKLDGSGYPFRMSADELTIFPRIAAVADVYDALITDRPYRAGLLLEEVLRMIQKEALEGLLDADVVAAMVRIADRWEERRRDDPLLRGLFAVGNAGLARMPAAVARGPDGGPGSVERTA